MVCAVTRKTEGRAFLAFGSETVKRFRSFLPLLSTFSNLHSGWKK